MLWAASVVVMEELDRRLHLIRLPDDDFPYLIDGLYGCGIFHTVT